MSSHDEEPDDISARPDNLASRLGRAWRDRCEGRPFRCREERLWATVMADHPEWIAFWRWARSLPHIRVLLPDGRNPYSAVMFEALTEKWLEDGILPECTATYEALRARGFTHAETRAELTRAYQAAYVGPALDEATLKAQVHAITNRVQEGDRVEDIVPPRMRGWLWLCGLGSVKPDASAIEEAERMRLRLSFVHDDEE
jgi:hypothetical protein